MDDMKCDVTWLPTVHLDPKIPPSCTLILMSLVRTVFENLVRKFPPKLRSRVQNKCESIPKIPFEILKSLEYLKNKWIYRYIWVYLLHAEYLGHSTKILIKIACNLNIEPIIHNFGGYTCFCGNIASLSTSFRKIAGNLHHLAPLMKGFK